MCPAFPDRNISQMWRVFLEELNLIQEVK